VTDSQEDEGDSYVPILWQRLWEKITTIFIKITNKYYLFGKFNQF